MKPIRFLIFWIVCATLLATGCFGGSEEPTPTPPPPTATQAATVAPATATSAPPTPAAKANAPTSPLAVPPTSPLATPAAAPSQSVTTTAKTGAVVGTVIVKSDKMEKPVSDFFVALAEVIKQKDGPPKATGYDAAHAPRGDFDSQGHFVINNVPPGDYGIILDSVRSSIMLNDPKTGNSIIVAVKAHEVTDIGTLTYKSLPIDGYK